MYYFAYGSNMDYREMRVLCPSAAFIAVAKLPDHRLEFTRYSETHGCGVADAVPEHGHRLWGVVYDIAEAEFGRLDQSEGYQPGRPAGENHYVREERHVLRDGHQQEPLLVSLYLANREPHMRMPNSSYRGLLLEGARFWHLPADYVQELEKIEIV